MKTDIIAKEAIAFGRHTIVETRDGAVTDAEAVEAVRAAGFAVIEESDGGQYDSYVAEDAHGTIGATPGHAGVAITVQPDK